MIAPFSIEGASSKVGAVQSVTRRQAGLRQQRDQGQAAGVRGVDRAGADSKEQFATSPDLANEMLNAIMDVLAAQHDEQTGAEFSEASRRNAGRAAGAGSVVGNVEGAGGICVDQRVQTALNRSFAAPF